MKLLLIFLLTSLQVLAYEVPKDAVIKVYDHNGNLIGNMSRKQYKVVSLASHQEMVPREAFDRAERDGLALANENQQLRQEYASKAKASEDKSHEIKYSAILSGGVGKDGLSLTHSPGNTTISESVSPVGMAQLCATKNGVGLCADAASNSFFGLGVKLDLNK